MTVNESNEPRDEKFVEHEEELAAEEAAAIGGGRPDYDTDEAHRALEEAGEGEAEGFEDAEAELIDAASHGGNRHNPADDAFTPEVESDESGAAYGEPDELDPTEVVEDPDAEFDEDDPGEGPGIAADR
jgi:hypothetical protein